MTKTYEPIAESLNEIINDLEKNDGKNLKRESLSIVAEYKSTKQSHHLIMNSLDNSGQFDTDDMIKAVFACFQKCRFVKEVYQMKTATNLNQDDPRFMAFLALSFIQDSAEQSGTSNMSLDEINDEISKAREKLSIKFD